MTCLVVSTHGSPNSSSQKCVREMTKLAGARGAVLGGKRVLMPTYLAIGRSEPTVPQTALIFLVTGRYSSGR